MAFELNNATFGTLYSFATLSGAVALPWLGQWIDRIPLLHYSLCVAAALFAASIMMAISWHISMLFISLIMLRLAGQGLSSHTASATMARHYDGHRGKALSISSIGYPLGEAILPSVIAAALVYFHWRTTWGFIAAVIALVFIPAIWYLVRTEQNATEKRVSVSELKTTRENYRDIFSDSRTLFVIPATIMPAFWITGLFLYQIAAADSLGWSVTLIASAFVAFALARIISGLAAGPVIDRFSARSIFPFYLLPMISGFFIAFYAQASWAAFTYMGLVGVTMGVGSTMKAALWAEMFGTKMIGTVQSLFATIMVLSTAVSPFFVGWMLDASYGMHTILLIAAFSSIGAGLLAFRVYPLFDRSVIE